MIPITNLFDVPWSERSFGLIALITLGTLMVGFGEELVMRGILLNAVRARHGELAVLFITSIVFGLAHAPVFVLEGIPPLVIVFQVVALAAAGATYYWIRRVTGSLWIGILVHAFTDWVLYLGAASETPSASMPVDHTTNINVPFAATVQILLWIALTIVLISVIRETRRNKQQMTVASGAAL
ncbi:CPBP family intramembrane glutamic endopeptidase [Paenarthrobacter nitroguajacolicus]|uniref:CPBP family intramembrane glutamic endopeptidase n=1 Tax=Paenarthrobacter nitroguajacolicus TaxID=211146 RepID=UPI003ADB42FA